MWIRRVWLVFAFFLPTCLQAQAPKYAWGNLSQLRPGQKIQVVDMQMKTFGCEFVSFTDDAIVIRRGKAVESIERVNVERISIRDTSRRGRNMILGAAIAGGIALGASIPFMVSSESGCSPCAIAIPAAFGAGAGLGAGATHRTIYRADKVVKGGSSSGN